MQKIIVQTLTRRHFLHLLPGALGFFTGISASESSLLVPSRQSLVNRFLGESLYYQIGFWLIPRCGAVRTSFSQTEHSRIYRAAIEGCTTGIIDTLIGRIRYSFVSYMEYVDDEDRLKPVYFQLRKRHMQKESIRSVAYDYKSRKIFYFLTAADADGRTGAEDMQNGTIYEDYLSLFYNFRHGVYGSLEGGRTYQIPLHIRKGMNSMELAIATLAQSETQRNKESDKIDKDFFLRFNVVREDVSSKSGEVEGWLSADALPMKGTIKDVVFFGDLWGELEQRKVEDPNKTVPIPGAVRDMISPDLMDDR